MKRWGLRAAYLHLGFFLVLMSLSILDFYQFSVVSRLLVVVAQIIKLLVELGDFPENVIVPDHVLVGLAVTYFVLQARTGALLLVALHPKIGSWRLAAVHMRLPDFILVGALALHVFVCPFLDRVELVAELSLSSIAAALVRLSATDQSRQSRRIVLTDFRLVRPLVGDAAAARELCDLRWVLIARPQIQVQKRTIQLRIIRLRVE